LGAGSKPGFFLRAPSLLISFSRVSLAQFFVLLFGPSIIPGLYPVLVFLLPSVRPNFFSVEESLLQSDSTPLFFASGLLHFPLDFVAAGSYRRCSHFQVFEFFEPIAWICSSVLFGFGFVLCECAGQPAPSLWLIPARRCESFP
jgi:hypothetical protein